MIKDKQDKVALATNKYNPFKTILAEYALWETDDINKTYWRESKIDKVFLNKSMIAN